MTGRTLYFDKYLKYKNKYLKIKNEIYGGKLTCKLTKLFENFYDEKLKRANKIFTVTLYFTNTDFNGIKKIDMNIDEKYLSYLKGIIASTQNLISNFGDDYKIRLYTAGLTDIINNKKFEDIINKYKNEEWSYYFMINNKDLNIDFKITYGESIFNFLLNAILSKRIEIYNYDCENTDDKINYTIMGTFGTVMRFFPFFMKEDNNLEEIHVRDADQIFATYTDLVTIIVWKLLDVNYYFPNIYNSLHQYVFMNIINKDKLEYNKDSIPTFAICGGKPLKNITDSDIDKIFESMITTCNTMKEILREENQYIYNRNKIERTTFFFSLEQEYNKIYTLNVKNIVECGYGFDEIFLGYTLFNYMKSSYIIFPMSTNSSFNKYAKDIIQPTPNNYLSVLKPDTQVFRFKEYEQLCGNEKAKQHPNTNDMNKMIKFFNLIDVNWDIFMLIYTVRFYKIFYEAKKLGIEKFKENENSLLNEILKLLKSNINVDKAITLMEIFNIGIGSISYLLGPLFSMDFGNQEIYKKYNSGEMKAIDVLRGIYVNFFNQKIKHINMEESQQKIEDITKLVYLKTVSYIKFPDNDNNYQEKQFIITYLYSTLGFPMFLTKYSMYEDIYKYIEKDKKDNINIIKFNNKNELIVIFDNNEYKLIKKEDCKELCFKVETVSTHNHFLFKIVENKYFINMKLEDMDIIKMINTINIDNIQKIISMKKIVKTSRYYSCILAQYFDGMPLQKGEIKNFTDLDIKNFKNIIFELLKLIKLFKDNRIAFVDIQPNNVIFNKENDKIYLIDLEHIINYDTRITQYGFYSPSFKNKKKTVKQGYEEEEEIENIINDATLLESLKIMNETIDLYCLGSLIIDIINDKIQDITFFSIIMDYARYLQKITEINMKLTNTTNIFENLNYEQIKDKVYNMSFDNHLDRPVEKVKEDMEILFSMLDKEELKDKLLPKGNM